jgi:hypothetical protein
MANSGGLGSEIESDGGGQCRKEKGSIYKQRRARCSVVKTEVAECLTLWSRRAVEDVTWSCQLAI